MIFLETVLKKQQSMLGMTLVVVLMLLLSVLKIYWRVSLQAHGNSLTY